MIHDTKFRSVVKKKEIPKERKIKDVFFTNNDERWKRRNEEGHGLDPETINNGMEEKGTYNARDT